MLLKSAHQLRHALKMRLMSSPGVRRILSNTGWLFIDRIVRMGLGLLVGLWVARYLGPEQFGIFNYATAFITIFSVIASMGLETSVVRDLVRNPENAPEILGTTFVLRLLGAVTAYGAACATIWIMHPQDPVTVWAVAILGAGMIFQATDTIDLWFQAKVRAKFTVIAKSAAFFALSLAKVALILNGAPLLAFVWAGLTELALGMAALCLSYHIAGGEFRAWRFSTAQAIAQLKDGWPLVLSAFSVIIYMKIDQVMLGGMRGNAEVGIYSAAVRLSEVWYFIPTAIATSVYPTIVASKEVDEGLYLNRIQMLYDYTVWIFLIIAAPISLLSGPLVTLLFGPDYREAGIILAIHIWSSIFVSLGVARGKWLVTEGLMRFAMLTQMMGCISNILLNLLLIPKMGGTGAAIATLISYAIASYLSCFFHPKTWHAGRMLTLALVAPVRVLSTVTSRKKGGHGLGQ